MGLPRLIQLDLFRSGLVRHGTVMREQMDPHGEGERLLDTTETIYHVAEAIGSLWRLYYALGVPEEEGVTIEFTYEDTKQRELVDLNQNRIGLPRGLVCDSPKIDVSETYPLYLWRASDAQISAEICLEIFQPFHWKPSRRRIEDEIRPFLGRLPLGASV